MDSMRLNTRARNAERALEELRSEASQHGLEIQVSCKPPKSVIWKITRDGKAIVQFNASKGKVMLSNGKMLGLGKDPKEALAIAIRAANGTLLEEGKLAIAQNEPNRSENAEEGKEQAAQQSQEMGLELHVGYIKARRLCAHWQWNHPALGRILNWWPNTGRWTSYYGSGDEIHTPGEAMELVCRLLRGSRNGMARQAFQ